MHTLQRLPSTRSTRFSTITLALVLALTSCASTPPRGLLDVSDFDETFARTLDRILGAWKGKVAGVTPVFIRFERTPSGQYTCLLDGSTERDVPGSALRIEGDLVQLELERSGCSFDGVLSSDRSSLDGTFTERNGARHALSLERVDLASLTYMLPRVDESGTRELGYTYTPPPAGADGLPVGRVSTRTEQSITELMEKVLDETYPGIESILIAKDGTLVVEEYFYGFERDRPHQLRSMTKSVASILTGIAIQQGLLRGVDERVASFYPVLAEEQNWNERKRRMTVEHLITMTTGFEGDDWDDDFASYKEMSQTPDWIQFATARAVIHEPGESFAYNGSSLMVLTGILESATGMQIPEFANRQLFGPLGIEYARWKKSPKGPVSLGGGLKLLPRDLIKIGQLYLNKGRWGEQQIVFESWVSESERSRNLFWGPRRAYGYLWYKKSFGWFDSIDGYFASGMGGQKLLYAPELSLVVLITTGNYDASRTVQLQSFDILARIIAIAADRGERFTDGG